MKVSIVIPTYNQGPFIGECLESIRTQSHDDLEAIIQDACSTDATREICERVAGSDARFSYHRERDRGQSDAINRGLARSTGELWTWLCSDDRYSDASTVARLVAAFGARRASDPSVVGAFGDGRYIAEDGREVAPYGNLTRDLLREDFQLTWPLAQPGAVLLRERVVAVGGLDAELPLGMDLDLLLRVLAGGRRLVYAPGVVADVRIQAGSKTVRNRRATAETALALVRAGFGSIGNPFRSIFAFELGQSIVTPLDEALDSWMRSYPLPRGRRLVERALRLFVRGAAHVARLGALRVPRPLRPHRSRLR